MRQTLLIVLTAACSLTLVGAAESTKIARPTGGSRMCPMVYQPVCAGGRTFSNACVAANSGFTGGAVRVGACDAKPQAPKQVGSGPCKEGEELHTPKCPPGARCLLKPYCRPAAKQCKAGERLVFRGTRSERCVPALAAPKSCSTGFIRVCPRCITRAGSACSCFCAASGNRTAKGLCPTGMKWESTCPKGARCIIGGRCVPAAPGKCPPGLVWKQVGGVGACQKGTPIPGKKRCPEGSELRNVMCIRAPCPALCVPTSKLPAKPVLPLTKPVNTQLKVKPL